MKSALMLLLFASFAIQAAESPKVSIETAKIESVDNSLNYPVQIRSFVDAQIKADADLIVMKHLVRLGQQVEKGDPILELRHPDLNTSYKNRIFRAPMPGVVAGIHAPVGNSVTNGTLLVSINDPKKVYGQVEIPVADFKKMKIGLPAKLKFDQFGVKGIEATVAGIGAMVDSKLGTVPVELNLSESVLPGSIGMASISLKKEDMILVDEKVLYFSGDDVFLAIVEEESIKKKKIELGRRFKNRIEIKTGVAEGEIFVSDSPKFLRDGQKVQIVKKDGKSVDKTL